MGFISCGTLFNELALNLPNFRNPNPHQQSGGNMGLQAHERRPAKTRGFSHGHFVYACLPCR